MKHKNIIKKVIKMYCEKGITRNQECQLRTPQFGCIGCVHFISPLTPKKMSEQSMSDNKSHISNILFHLKQDSEAPQWLIEHKELENYLYEVTFKDGSLLSGIISALERYLGK